MKRRSLSWTLLLLALAASDIACESTHRDEGKPTGAVCPQTQTLTLTYDNFGQGFLQKYCLRCHSESVAGADRGGAPGDHNFDLHVDVMLLADHIDEHAGSGPDATNTIMPPSDPRPTMSERRQLSEWLACGAP